MKSAVRFAVLLLFLTAACSTPQERVRPYDGYLPEVEQETIVAFFISDAVTGKPIAGAKIRRHIEGWPTDDARWAEVIGEATTDEYGLAWIALGDHEGDCHWAVHADGYAPAEEYGRIPESTPEKMIALERGESFHGRLLGPFGDPLVGARVGWKLGCAHSPSLAATTTDDTGRYVFECVGPGESPIERGGVMEGYASARPVEFPAPVEMTSPSRAIEGRILLADGTPPPWAIVHNLVTSRGPLARVDKHGRFRFEAGMPRQGFTVYLPDETHQISARDFPGDRPFVYRMGVTDEARPFEVVVDTEHAVAGVFVRTSDGRNFPFSPGQVVSIAAGEYRVEVGGTFTQFRGAVVGFNPAENRTVRVPLREQARLEIVWQEPALSENAAVTIHVEGQDERLDDEEQAGTYLPGQSRAVLIVHAEGARVIVPVKTAQDNRRLAVVKFPGKKRIRLPGVNRYFLIWGEQEFDEGSIESDLEIVYTRATGRIVALYDDMSHASCLAEYDLPEHSDEIIEPSSLKRTQSEPRRVRLLLADGSPAVEAYVAYRDQFDYSDPGGFAKVAGISAGSVIRVQASDVVSRTATLQGDPPYEFRWGACSLRFSIPDAPGLKVWLDGSPTTLPRSSILAGLSEGPHTLIIGAPGRKHYVMRVVLKPGETRVIDLALPRIAAPR